MSIDTRLRNWLIFTVAAGALPILLRTLIFCITARLGFSYVFNLVDLVTFGLVLNISNITDLQYRTQMPKSTKQIYGVGSVAGIILMAIFLGIAYNEEFYKPAVEVHPMSQMIGWALIGDGLCLYFSFSLVKFR